MSETFFGFDEDDEFGAPARRHRSPWRWITAAIVLVALIGCGLLCLAGVRTVEDARQNQEWVGRSWVIQGQYATMTQDLQTTSHNAVYSGTLPSSIDQHYDKYYGGIADPKKVQAGGQIQFRGTQTGAQREDFPEIVDALLVNDDGTLTVERTTPAGEMSPITEDGIRTQQRHGWLLVGGGVLVLALGAVGTVYGVRRMRRDED